MAVADNHPVSDTPVRAGSTPDSGKSSVYSGSIVRFGDDNRMVLTDRIDHGDYLIDTGETEDDEDEDDEEDDEGGGGDDPDPPFDPSLTLHVTDFTGRVENNNAIFEWTPATVPGITGQTFRVAGNNGVTLYQGSGPSADANYTSLPLGVVSGVSPFRMTIYTTSGQGQFGGDSEWVYLPDDNEG